MHMTNKLSFVPVCLALASGCLSDGDVAELGVFRPNKGGLAEARPEPERGDAAITRPPATKDGGAGAVVDGTDAQTLFSMGGAAYGELPIEYDDADLRCYRITAHAAGDATGPYAVPARAAAHWVNVTVRLPIEGKQIIRSIRPLTDNGRVLHHWTLWREHADTPDGVALGKLAHPQSAVLYAFGPETQPVYLNPELGIHADGGSAYTLEIRYNNSADVPASDASGVELCITPRPVLYRVGFAHLGAVPDSRVDEVSAVCSPQLQETIHVLGVHTQFNVPGASAQLEVLRPDGVVEEMPAFEGDRTYGARFDIPPAASLRTRCRYDSRADYQPQVDDEACDVLVLHYHDSTLTDGSPSGPWNPYSCGI
jgi:hypothetical protein